MIKAMLVIPTLSSGGAERVISILANHWASIGVKVHLVLLAEAEAVYPIDELIVLHKLGRGFTGKLNKLRAIFEVYLGLRNCIKENQPDFILSFNTPYNIFTILASFGLKVPLIVSDRNYIPLALPKSERVVRAQLYKLCSGIIYQTSDELKIRENVKLLEVLESEVIANPLRKLKIESRERENIILSVGRLVEQKGHRDLIQAFYHLENRKEWKLLILGDGPLRGALNKQIKQLNLMDEVKLLGRVNDVDHYFSRSKIFVFPSYFEGFPNALSEAMGAGLAVISYDCMTGPKDLIKNRVNGLLCELGKVSELTELMNELIHDELLIDRLSKNAIEVNHIYSEDKISRLYLDFCIGVSKKR
jgi:GalNAc-alpha-(1->4)-GalNAc-alpha-(1->3)-diNAcBac-PP-undecaprenol alpha-1,4-N-acetyl-D-galactosaminyltransferase